jgi:hypothetical protein
MNKTKIIVLDQTPNGYPCLAECGGATTSQGSATVYCAEDGKPLKAFYIPRGGHLCNGDHAFFSPRKNIIRIVVNGKYQDDSISIWKLKFWAENPDTGVWEGKYEVLAEYRAEDPHPEVGDYIYLREVGEYHFPQLKDAIYAASRKSGDYHCKSAYYVLLNK